VERLSHQVGRLGGGAHQPVRHGHRDQVRRRDAIDVVVRDPHPGVLHVPAPRCHISEYGNSIYIRNVSKSQSIQSTDRHTCDAKAVPAGARQHLQRCVDVLPGGGRVHPQFQDQSRRDIGKSQSLWTDSKIDR
jgi:hypothetical protein